MLTQARLKEILHYDPETGVFTWLERRVGRKRSMSGSIRKGKYSYIGIDYIKYPAHRLAWFYMCGYFPECEVDHKDREPSNNKWSNLREISHVCNIRNANIAKNNTTGVTGVSYDHRRNKWAVCISVDYRTLHVGRHDSFNEAVCHRLAAEQCLDWHGCDDNSIAFQYVKNILTNTANRMQGE